MTVKRSTEPKRAKNTHTDQAQPLLAHRLPSAAVGLLQPAAAAVRGGPVAGARPGSVSLCDGSIAQAAPLAHANADARAALCHTGIGQLAARVRLQQVKSPSVHTQLTPSCAPPKSSAPSAASPSHT